MFSIFEGFGTHNAAGLKQQLLLFCPVSFKSCTLTNIYSSEIEWKIIIFLSCFLSLTLNHNFAARNIYQGYFTNSPFCCYEQLCDEHLCVQSLSYSGVNY